MGRMTTAEFSQAAADRPSTPRLDATAQGVGALGKALVTQPVQTAKAVVVDPVVEAFESPRAMGQFAGSMVDPLRLASRLRAEAETRDLPLMLIADEGQRDLVLRAFELGASDHVLRPINEEELRARVRNQVRRRRYQLRLRAEFDRSLELAVTDGLTGLRNRRYVFRHLESLLRAGTASGVLMIDVDRFKPLNDYYGHAAGDAALREVAARLREHVRASDIVARYGGEEFLVVMSGAGAEETAVIAERLRSAIADRPIDLGQAKLPVTVSIGSALSSSNMEAEPLIAAADSAMYRAKASGRNCVEAATEVDWRPV
jgi:two-component system cell cycle response regulator